MSDYRLDDALLLAVRAARPAVPEEAVSPNGATAKATLERVLASDPHDRTGGVATAPPRFKRSGSFDAPNPSRKLPLDVVVPAVSVIVVLLVAVVFLSLRGGGSPRSSAASGRGGLTLVYVAEPSPQVPHLTSAALQREVTVMRSRIKALGLAFGASVQILGGGRIVVTLPDVANTARAEQEVGQTAQLYFYDWEANALTPDGKTVASQLRAQAPTALQISQGTSFAAPGDPNAGSMTLYHAVKLASKQPKSVSSHNARLGPQYYMFGAPGSNACAAKARQQGTIPSAGRHCLLAGPDNETYTTSQHQAIKNLANQLPPGVTPADGQELVVQQGTVVLQAANPSAKQQVNLSSPQAQFFVLRDNVALRGSDITNPQQSTDSTGSPAVKFGFNPAGARAFPSVTRQIAHRGQDVSPLGQTLNQHFAVALDNQLVIVPPIDNKIYPDGVTSGGAVITGGLTTTSANQLAAQLRLGALPINLRLVSAKPRSPAHN
jgi:SecD/SecF fusion protein